MKSKMLCSILLPPLIKQLGLFILALLQADILGESFPVTTLFLLSSTMSKDPFLENRGWLEDLYFHPSGLRMMASYILMKVLLEVLVLGLVLCGYRLPWDQSLCLLFALGHIVGMRCWTSLLFLKEDTLFFPGLVTLLFCFPLYFILASALHHPEAQAECLLLGGSLLIACVCYVASFRSLLGLYFFPFEVHMEEDRK
jgi:hypothetical protein